jgi:hypothetical protein
VFIEKIIQRQCENNNTAEDICVEVFDSFIGSVMKADYLRTVHACRTSSLLLPPISLWETLIAPAYFSSHLEQPLNIIKDIFRNHPRWTMNTSVFNINNNITGEQFIQSKIFSNENFNNLIGCFICNNHNINIGDSRLSQAASESSLESYGGCNVTGTASALRYHATGLYSTLSKCNHSCVCNTVSRCTGNNLYNIVLLGSVIFDINIVVGTDVKISVCATRDINEGEEITTTYLHSVNPRAMSRKRRNKLLVQYLFECNCELCEEQKQAESDDSSDSEEEEEEEEDDEQ